MANKTLTPVDSWDDAKSPVNGDPDDQTLDEDCHQRAANRVHHVRQALLVPGGSGAVKVRTVGSVAALKALTGMIAGDIAMISDVGGRVWQFRTTTPIAGQYLGGDAPQVYVADDSTGWWFSTPDHRELRNMECVAYGDGSTWTARMTHTGTTDWTTITDGANPQSIDVAAREDDLLEVDWHGLLEVTVGAGEANYIRLNAYHSTDHVIPGGVCISPANVTGERINSSCSGIYQSPGNQTITVKAEIKNVAVGNTTYLYPGSQLKVKLIRPST